MTEEKLIFSVMQVHDTNKMHEKKIIGGFEIIPYMIFLRKHEYIEEVFCGIFCGKRRVS